MIAGGVTPLQGVDAGLDAIANACRYGLIRERLLSARWATRIQHDKNAC